MTNVPAPGVTGKLGGEGEGEEAHTNGSFGITTARTARKLMVKYAKS